MNFFAVSIAQPELPALDSIEQELSLFIRPDPVEQRGTRRVAQTPERQLRPPHRCRRLVPLPRQNALETGRSGVITPRVLSRGCCRPLRSGLRLSIGGGGDLWGGADGGGGLR